MYIYKTHIMTTTRLESSTCILGIEHLVKLVQTMIYTKFNYCDVISIIATVIVI